MMTNTADVMSQGMKCLTDALGVVGAEQFISTVIREKFDYTRWQRQYFDDMAPGEFGESALEYGKNHSFRGKAKRV